MKPIKSVALASAVASLFAASACGVGAEAPQPNGSSQEAVKCSGINSCAGTASCAGSLPDGGMHDCAGKNSCAGQGWVEVPRSECDAKGGTVVK